MCAELSAPCENLLDGPAASAYRRRLLWLRGVESQTNRSIEILERIAGQREFRSRAHSDCQVTAALGWSSGLPGLDRDAPVATSAAWLPIPTMAPPRRSMRRSA